MTTRPGSITLINTKTRHHERATKMTKTSVIKVAELAELVDCYMLFKRNNQDNSRLMALIANQTEYMQKRYWKLVTAALKANNN